MANQPPQGPHVPPNPFKGIAQGVPQQQPYPGQPPYQGQYQGQQGQQSYQGQPLQTQPMSPPQPGRAIHTAQPGPWAGSQPAQQTHFYQLTVAPELAKQFAIWGLGKWQPHTPEAYLQIAMVREAGVFLGQLHNNPAGWITGNQPQYPAMAGAVVAGYVAGKEEAKEETAKAVKSARRWAGATWGVLMTMVTGLITGVGGYGVGRDHERKSANEVGQMLEASNPGTLWINLGGRRMKDGKAEPNVVMVQVMRVPNGTEQGCYFLPTYQLDQFKRGVGGFYLDSPSSSVKIKFFPQDNTPPIDHLGQATTKEDLKGVVLHKLPISTGSFAIRDCKPAPQKSSEGKSR